MTLTIQSCDYGYSAKVINNSKTDILIEMKFDKAIMKEQIMKGRPYKNNIETFMNQGGILISFDTINQISKRKIRPNESYIVDEGLGGRPDFSEFISIIIYSQDTLVLDSKVKIEEAFKKIKARTFVLEIK